MGKYHRGQSDHDAQRRRNDPEGLDRRRQTGLAEARVQAQRLLALSPINGFQILHDLASAVRRDLGRAAANLFGLAGASDGLDAL